MTKETPAKVLVVEDERDIAALVAYHLTREGYRVRTAEGGQEALQALAAERPDLVLLDLMLPGLSGYEVLAELRRRPDSVDLPVVVLTARRDEADRVKGLELGADDYVTKPFSPRELLARVQAVLRRTSAGAAGTTIEAGVLKLDPTSHRVTVDDQTVALGPTEYRLLQFFMEHPERVYSRGQLLDRVWGGNVYVEERTVDVHIRRLRKALEPYASDGLVQTVRGAGYRFSTRPE
jgi:two-component system phosphate regulon response regulator PhoB